MTVAELIEKLKEMPQDCIVMSGIFPHYFSVEAVESISGGLCLLENSEMAYCEQESDE